MDGKALRREPRIPFESTVQLVGTSGAVAGEVCDLSRSGCRIQAKLTEFGLGDSAGLPAILEGVREVLGRRFELVMQARHREREREVGKSAVLVRMAVVPGKSPVLDLGCLFADPLHDEEARRLGVHAGALGDQASGEGEREGIAWDLVAGHGTRADEGATPTKPEPVFTRQKPRDRTTDQPQRRLVARPKQRHDGEMTSKRTGPDQPRLYCKTETITPHAVLVRASNGLRGLGLRSGVDLATAAVAFTSRFGEHIHFSIGPASDPLWSGSASVCGFELPDDSEEDLIVTLTFDRALDSVQMARVGLR